MSSRSVYLGLLICVGCGGNADPTQVASVENKPIVSPPLSDTPSSDTEPTAPAYDSPFELEKEFELLTLDDFATFSTDESVPPPWAGTSDGLNCSGKPRGYLYSKTPFQNFTWRLEYRFPRPKSLTDETKFKGNTGFLVYITGEHKLWPICLEVQGKHVQMAAIKENGGAQPVTSKDDDVARQTARKPVGEWNQLEIISKDGALNVSLNGTPVGTSEPNFLSEGLIGIQAEDHPFEVRRMRIRRD